MLLLPSDEEPEGSIFKKDSRWFLDAGGEILEVSSDALVELSSGSFRLELVEEGGSSHCPTTTLGEDWHLDALGLEFTVNRDEGQIGLTLLWGAQRKSLGFRALNTLLLTLARARLEETRGEGDPLGWVDVSWLAKALSESIEKVNVDVHRARGWFAKAGVIDAHRVVERRPGQVRLGIAELRIVKE